MIHQIDEDIRPHRLIRTSLAQQGNLDLPVGSISYDGVSASLQCCNMLSRGADYVTGPCPCVERQNRREKMIYVGESRGLGGL